MEEKRIKLNICLNCMNRVESEDTSCPFCGRQPNLCSNPENTLPEGTILFRKYLVGKMIGRGGFGVTYIGYDLDLQLKVAIKEYFPAGVSFRSSKTYDVISDDSDSEVHTAFSKGCESFLDEARMLASVNSTSIVHVRDFFHEHGTAYIVMDYVDGKTLTKVLHEHGGKIEAHHLVNLMLPLIDQLDELHKKNIIHRDIKPDNIMLVKSQHGDHLVLLDFGAARSFVSGNISKTFTAVVTPGFAPIEQYSQKSRQGAFTDVYGLCATIYYAITGIIPPSAIERNIDGDSIKTFHECGIKVPQHIENAIMHGLAIKSEDRIQTMHQLRIELCKNAEKEGLPTKTTPSILGAPYADAPLETGKDSLYQFAYSLMMDASSSVEDYHKAERLFTALGDYKKAQSFRIICQQYREQKERQNKGTPDKKEFTSQHYHEKPIQNNPPINKRKRPSFLFLFLCIAVIVSFGVFIFLKKNSKSAPVSTYEVTFSSPVPVLVQTPNPVVNSPTQSFSPFVETTSTKAETPTIALITDYGDITDMSFNQATYEACKTFADANGLTFQYYKPASDSDEDRITSIEKAIDDGYSVIIMPGYAFGPAIQQTVPKYDDITFIALDVSEGDIGFLAASVPPNLYCSVYREELGGYMVGYAAVKLGYTKLGFLGGMAFPDVIRYGYGFVQGADAAAVELGLTDVEVKYVYGNQFYGDSDITAYMDSWYAEGTQVVFACGGGIFTSVGEAASKVNAKVIGVDVDQSDIIDYLYGNGMTVTSAIKGLAPTINFQLQAIVDGTFAGGKVENLGLVSDIPAENYVQIAPSTQFSDSFTQADYEALVAAMNSGAVTVSNDITAEPAVSAITVDYQGNIK